MPYFPCFGLTSSHRKQKKAKAQSADCALIPYDSPAFASNMFFLRRRRFEPFFCQEPGFKAQSAGCALKWVCLKRGHIKPFLGQFISDQDPDLRHSRWSAADFFFGRKPWADTTGAFFQMWDGRFVGTASWIFSWALATARPPSTIEVMTLQRTPVGIVDCQSQFLWFSWPWQRQGPQAPLR